MPALRARPRLKQLILFSNGIGDDGVAALVAPGEGVLPSLEELDLEWNQVTDAGCAALVAICTYKIAYCVYCWTEFPVVDGATYELVGTTKTVDADTLAFNDLPSGLTSFSTLVDTLFLIFALAIPFGKTVWLLYFSKGGKDAKKAAEPKRAAKK